jgi:hypothetical protein
MPKWVVVPWWIAVVWLVGCAGDDANSSMNSGTGGAPAGTGGAPAGTGGALAGTGGAPAGTGGAMGGTGGAMGGTGGAMGGGAGMSAPSGPPTFKRVWNEVLMGKSCSSSFCHGAGTGMLHMDNPEIAYMNLVGMPAAGEKCGTSGKMRVVPMDPDNSLLLDKISHDPPSCGDFMPIGAKLDPNCNSTVVTVCNTQAEIQLVRDWIAQGAMND